MHDKAILAGSVEAPGQNSSCKRCTQLHSTMVSFAVSKRCWASTKLMIVGGSCLPLLVPIHHLPTQTHQRMSTPKLPRDSSEDPAPLPEDRGMEHPVTAHMPAVHSAAVEVEHEVALVVHGDEAAITVQGGEFLVHHHTHGLGER